VWAGLRRLRGLGCLLHGPGRLASVRVLGGFTRDGILVACSRALWAESIVPEVYAMNAAMVGLSVLILARFQGLALPGWRWSWASAWQAIHPVPGRTPSCGVRLCAGRQRLPTRLVVSASLGLLAGAAVLVMALRAQTHPVLNWGDPGDWKGSGPHLARRQYVTPWSDPRNLWKLLFQLKSYSIHLGLQWGWCLTILIPIGVVQSFRSTGG